MKTVQLELIPMAKPALPPPLPATCSPPFRKEADTPSWVPIPSEYGDVILRFNRTLGDKGWFRVTRFAPSLARVLPIALWERRGGEGALFDLFEAVASGRTNYPPPIGKRGSLTSLLWAYVHEKIVIE